MIFCLLALATTASHANAERDHAISSPVTDSEPQCPFTIQEVSLLQHAVRISQTALPFEILQVQPSSAPQYPRQPAKNVTSVVNGTWIAELLRMFRPLYYNEPERSQVHKRVVHTWWSDLIPDSYHTILPDGDEGLSFFTSAPHTEWFILAGTCVALSLIDFLLLQRLPSTFGVHCAVLAFWICAALAYGIALRCRTNHSAATEWFSGYMLEWILSMDNLFVFHLVLESFRTPAKQVHKAVFVGIIGAVLIRMVFFMVVSTLLHLSHWIRFPFGLLLVWSGVEAARGGDDDDVNVEDTRLVKIMKWVLGSRLHDGYDERGLRSFIVGADGKLQATLLFVVIASLECTDVLFALDSVSAKVAQIPNQYLAFSSSVLAMYGLRAMFFIVKDLVAMFELLQYGLCLILVFIGVELMLADYINMSSSTVCVLIASVFAVCISGSMALRCTRKHDKDLADVPDNEIVNNGSAAQALEGGRMDARIPG